MIGAACLTLAAIHALIWLRQRTDGANALFSVMAAGTAGLSVAELWMMRAETPAEFSTAVQWLHLPAWVIVLGVVGFVRVYLRAGRPWLAWTVVVVRTLSLVLNFAISPNLNYREITAVRRIPFLGEPISVAEGTPNPWMLVGQLSLVLLVIFVADATVTVWRRGDRRRALVVGGSMVFFAVGGTTQAVVALWGILPMPITASVFFLGIVGAMGYELSREVLRAAELSWELSESEARFRIVADAAPVLIWMSGLDKLCNFFNKPWLDFTGRTLGQEMGNGWAEGVHPGDLDRCLKTYTEAFEARRPFEMQYRLRRHDGEYRWLLDKGVPRYDAQRSFSGYIGACTDVTERRRAQEEARALTGRLIHAQEEERARIARELHDDLNQRLALLSVTIDLLCQMEPAERSGKQLEEMAAEVRELSSVVHELAYELHPAKLDQLGLVAAAGSLCRELSQQAGVQVDFRHNDVPPHLPADVALCLFRIIQESLHNVVRHSGAKEARVDLTAEPEGIRLAISDAGKGFEMNGGQGNGGLGLLSMQERVRLLKGTIAVNSRPGQGTRVELTVPLPEKEVAV
jgi:PAS domain S-box-containing protein